MFLLAPGTITFKPKSTDLTLALVLARGSSGVEWAAAMEYDVVKTLFADAILEKLEGGVAKLLYGEPRLERLSVGGAEIVRGEDGIVATGALGFFLEQEFTLAAVSLNTAIRAANKVLEENRKSSREVTADKTPNLPSPQFRKE